MRQWRGISALVLLAVVGGMGVSEAGTLPAVLTWTNLDTTNQIQINKAPAALGPWAKLTVTAAGTLTYTDATNAPGDTACFKLQYSNSSGLGPDSIVACKTFPSVPTVAPVLGPIQ